MKIILDGKNDNNSEIVNGPATDQSLDETGNSNNKASEKITTSKNSENPSCIVEKELRRQGITLNELVSDNPRLSLDWQPFRWVTQCTCASPIDALTRKVSLYCVDILIDLKQCICLLHWSEIAYDVLPYIKGLMIDNVYLYVVLLT